MFIETETTPNPATLKFLPGREVMSASTREFTNEEDAAASPLAEALFSLGDVTGVFQVEGAGMRKVLQQLRPK